MFRLNGPFSGYGKAQASPAFKGSDVEVIRRRSVSQTPLHRSGFVSETMQLPPPI